MLPEFVGIRDPRHSRDCQSGQRVTAGRIGGGAKIERLGALLPVNQQVIGRCVGRVAGLESERKAHVIIVPATGSDFPCDASAKCSEVAIEKSGLTVHGLVNAGATYRYGPDAGVEAGYSRIRLGSPGTKIDRRGAADPENMQNAPNTTLRFTLVPIMTSPRKFRSFYQASQDSASQTV